MNENELSAERRIISARLINDLLNLVEDWKLSDEEQLSLLGGCTAPFLQAHFNKDNSAMLSESTTERLVLLGSINKDLIKLIPCQTDIAYYLRSNKFFVGNSLMDRMIGGGLREFLSVKQELTKLVWLGTTHPKDTMTERI